LAIVGSILACSKRQKFSADRSDRGKLFMPRFAVLLLGFLAVLPGVGAAQAKKECEPAEYGRSGTILDKPLAESGAIADWAAKVRQRHSALYAHWEHAENKVAACESFGGGAQDPGLWRCMAQAEPCRMVDD
jgi:hypothetical protein